MHLILARVIPPKLGFGLIVASGQHLRIVDLEGKQVVDMALFSAATPGESCRPPIRELATRPGPARRTSPVTSSPKETCCCRRSANR